MVVQCANTRRTDSTLGAVCGLGIAAAAWTLATSPALSDLAFWLFLAGGMLACLWQPRLPGAGRVGLSRTFTVSALVLFGLGPAVLAQLFGSLIVMLGREERRSPGFRLAALYEIPSGVLVTLLASLAYLAAGGTTGGEIPGTVLVPLLAFVLMSTVSERLADAVAAHTLRIRMSKGEMPGGWLRIGLHNAGGAVVGLLVCLAYLTPVTQPWLWALPSLGFFAFLQSSREEDASIPAAGLTPVSRSIARALSHGLEPGREPNGAAERRRAVAVDVGRRLGLDETRLDVLETAAWLFEFDRLAVQPPLADRPTTRRFRREPDVRIDELEILSALGVPKSVREILIHRHERWDGAGAPDGLTGAQIPRGARVLSAVGSYISMTFGGPDRPPLAPHRALGELRNEAGRIFDPRVIETLADVIREVGCASTVDGNNERSESRSAALSAEPSENTGLPAVQHELHALYEISRAVNYRLDLEENLTLILDKLESLVPYACAVVYLQAPERDGLRARFVRGIGVTALEGVVISASASPSGKAFAERRSMTGRGGRARMPYDPGEWDLDALADSPLNAVLRTALASPLVFGGRSMGTLTIYDRAGRRFGAEERRRVAAVGGHVARAVHNADPRSPGYLESLTDPLTGLPNGRYLEICSRDLLPSTTGAGTGFGLLAFRVRDLDRLCERSGIAAVERLLAVLARRLASNCTDAEVPVRYGQDLFVVLSPSAAQGELVRRWDILLRAAGDQPLELHVGVMHDLRLASAHVSCPEDGEDLDGLLEVLGTRLGLAYERGHSVVPFRPVRSVS